MSSAERLLSLMLLRLGRKGPLHLRILRPQGPMKVSRGEEDGMWEAPEWSNSDPPPFTEDKAKAG